MNREACSSGHLLRRENAPSGLKNLILHLLCKRSRCGSPEIVHVEHVLKQRVEGICRIEAASILQRECLTVDTQSVLLDAFCADEKGEKIARRDCHTSIRSIVLMARQRLNDLKQLVHMLHIGNGPGALLKSTRSAHASHLQRCWLWLRSRGSARAGRLQRW